MAFLFHPREGLVHVTVNGGIAIDRVRQARVI